MIPFPSQSSPFHRRRSPGEGNERCTVGRCGRALFTGAVSLVLGLCFLRHLAIHLTRVEQCVFGFLIGNGALSLVVFLFTAAHLAYAPVFISFGLLTIAIGFIRLRSLPKVECSVCVLSKLWFCFAGLLCFRYAKQNHNFESTHTEHSTLGKLRSRMNP